MLDNYVSITVSHLPVMEKKTTMHIADQTHVILIAIEVEGFKRGHGHCTLLPDLLHIDLGIRPCKISKFYIR